MRPKKAERKDAYIIVRVSKAEHRSLKDLARQRGVSLSDLIRVALQSNRIGSSR
jgi:predicted HicB family RNase H-like nuclease